MQIMWIRIFINPFLFLLKKKKNTVAFIPARTAVVPTTAGGDLVP